MTTVSTTPGPAAIGADDKELAPGQEVGEYRIESVLGRGGFGTVYAAIQPVIGKRVAIKVLARKYAADQDVVSRFAAEARAVNQIRHRNIIDIFSFGQLPDGRHYYVMEHLEGEPLDSYIRAHGAMALDDALPILRSIARALDAAHAKGIAHRDLKPENIFLANDPDGGVFPKLLDFGIAKLMAPEDSVMHRTGTGVPIGTPYYMSPEQCRGRDVDRRTDIYSFGIVVYRLLTGAFPFEGDDYLDLMFKQVNEDPPLPTSKNPALPSSVDIAIAWMMQKDRELRPKTVLEGINALDPSASVTPSSLTPAPKRGSQPSVSRTGRGPQTTPAELALAETGISSPNALAETRAAAAVAPMPAKSRVWLWVLALVVLGGAGVAVYLQMRPPQVVTTSAEAPKQDVKAVDSTQQNVKQPVVAPDATAQPDRVEITFAGAPDGAKVWLEGKLMAVTPKPLKLPYGTEQVEVVLEHDSHLPLSVSVTPDKDGPVEATMKKKPTRTGGSRPKDKDDVESPFKK